MSEVVVDPEAMTVYVDGQETYLSNAAYRVFCLLWEKRGKMVPHRAIVEASCSFEDRSWYLDQLAMSRQLYSRSRNLIYQIRKALGDAVDIRDRRGVGYRLEASRGARSEWTRRATAGGHEVWAPPR